MQDSLCIFISFYAMKNIVLIFTKSELNSPTSRLYIYLKYLAYMTSWICTDFFQNVFVLMQLQFVQFLSYFVFKKRFSARNCIYAHAK